MKKGRHRRFEEARALKRDNGANTEEDYAAWLADPDNVARPQMEDEDDDVYAKYAEKYGALDDDDDADGPASK